MDLSPNDLRNYEFAHQMRGYDREEVDNFLEQVATGLEALKQDNLKLSMEVDSLKTQLAGLRQFEDTIKSAAIDARRNADMTIANAKKEAELTLSRAKSEAEGIVGSHTHKVSELEEQITKLQLAKKSYLTKLRNLIKSHLMVLEEVASVESPTDEPKSSLEVTDSTEVTTNKLETIATMPAKPEPIKTEPANDAETIIPSSPDTAESAPSLTAPEDASEDEAQPPEQALDPELAAALESYQRKASSPTEEEKAAEPTTDQATAPGQLVETTARAEDVPTGFIAKDNDNTTSEVTDKISTGEEEQPSPTEHNAITVDTETDTQEEDSSLGPESLAEELDRVVAKFEEEMDKAEKN